MYDANLIPPNKKAEVEQKLRQLRTDKDIWLVVWTTPSLNGNPIETLAVDQFKKWKLGDKKKDNALLLLIAAKDRKMRMEVGYGLDGDFPDVRVKQLLDDIIRPSLKNNNLSEGILNLVSHLSNKPHKNQEPEEKYLPRLREDVLKTLSPQVIDLTNSVDGDTLSYFNNQVAWRLEEGLHFWIIVGAMSEASTATKLIPPDAALPRLVLYLDLDQRSAALLSKPGFGTPEEWLEFENGINNRLKVAHPINALGGSNGEIRSMLNRIEIQKTETKNADDDKIVGYIFSGLAVLISLIFGFNYKRKLPYLGDLTLLSQTKSYLQETLQKQFDTAENLKAVATENSEIILFDLA